jgi:transcription antitermination factor NusG
MENTQTVGFEIVDTKLPWFALQVRTTRELSVANLLRGRGYTPFLPLYRCRKRWSDRIKVVDAPLFPGYVFCRLNIQHRLPVLMIPAVTQIVGYSRVPARVDEAEINAIQTVVASGFPNQPWPFLQVGDWVRIERGPLCGVEGILLSIRGSHRLVLSVSLLQRSVALEIDALSVKWLRSTPAPLDEKGSTLPPAAKKDLGAYASLLQPHNDHAVNAGVRVAGNRA